MSKREDEISTEGGPGAGCLKSMISDVIFRENGSSQRSWNQRASLAEASLSVTSMLSSRLRYRPALVRFDDPMYARRSANALPGAWKMYVLPCSGASVKTLISTAPDPS